jgi:hypothetical protein
MADIIRKVTVPKESLPPVGSDNNYLFRFRIVSEDANRTSSWSPIYSIAGQSYEESQVDGVLSKLSASAIMATWVPLLGNVSYDVFVSLDEGDYVYSGTTGIHNYSFISKLPNGTPATSVGVIVQTASQDRIVSNPLIIWSSGIQAISAII